MPNYEGNIPRPDLKDRLSWANIKQTRIDWLRAICPQVDFDTPRVILGEGMGDIYGDDPNSFGIIFISDLIDDARKTLKIIMNTRINTPELPEHIRERLTAVKDHVLAIDWNTEAGYKEAKAYYKKKAANFVQHQIALHKEYREAYRYSDRANQTLSSLWQDFLYGSHIG
jgi:hypothetical protein